MAESDSGEKTEDATPQKREDFRKKGQVVQTKELGTVFTLFGAVLSMWALGGYFFQNVLAIFHTSFGTFVYQASKTQDLGATLGFVGQQFLKLIVPVMGFFWLLSFASSVMQIGFLVNEEAMQLKPERLNPLEGLKKIFSMRSLVEGIKSVLKVTAVCGVAFLILEKEINTLPSIVHFSIYEIMIYIGEIAVKLLSGVGFFMILIAASDFFFQKHDMEEKMKMSMQEIKEELKSREGDPLIRARIRRTQREMANKRMMSDVPTADVIVTNPTHIAVALKYSADMVSPKIVAMGADHVAQKIRELAKENKIPIVENKPLARVMFKTLKVGAAIPRELYTAVAEVLSYIFRLKNKRLS